MRYKSDHCSNLDAESLDKSKAENNKYVVVHYHAEHGIIIRERGLNPFYTEESKGLNMKLTKEDIDKQFNTRDGQIVTGFAMTKNYFVAVDVNETPIVYRLSGFSDEIGCDGLRCSEDDITSRHDPRSWLSQMPNLGDIKGGWITCDGDKEWCWYQYEPMLMKDSWNNSLTIDSFKSFNMPTLTGDQWKDSKISVAELKQWQADNEVGL